MTENVPGFETSILSAVTKGGLVENYGQRVANKNREIVAHWAVGVWAPRARAWNWIWPPIASLKPKPNAQRFYLLSHLLHSAWYSLILNCWVVPCILCSESRNPHVYTNNVREQCIWSYMHVNEQEQTRWREAGGASAHVNSEMSPLLLHKKQSSSCVGSSDCSIHVHTYHTNTHTPAQTHARLARTWTFTHTHTCACTVAKNCTVHGFGLCGASRKFDSMTIQ